MNTKTRKLAGRIVLLATVILLTLTMLAGCTSSSKKTTLSAGTVTADSNVNNLTAEQLGSIAAMMESVYSGDYDPREELVAASRGYDMTLQGFDDSKGDFPYLGMNLEAAKNVITKANGEAKDEYKVQFDYGNLNDADVNSLIKAFQTTVDMEGDGGFFDPLLKGIGSILRWITNTLGFGNYLVGICIFAVIIEILMLPFAIKQQKNSIRQAQLRPKEMAIRNKYKGRTDQVTMQKMQQEIQEFYQRENFSPYSGCLALFIQMPIIMALYSIVIDPLHYVMGQASGVSGALETFYSAARAAGGLGGSLGGNGTIAVLADIKTGGIAMLEGLKDFAYFTNGAEVFGSLDGIMGSIPNFNIGPFNFGLIPSIQRFDILLLVPVLTFVTYFLTSKLNRKFMAQPVSNGEVEDRQVACSNTMMDITMPAMSTVFTFIMPALVGVYWMFRSLVSLLKQFIISKLMPLPKFTEEDYKRAAKEMAGKRVVKKSDNVGKVRSLHHIDDEDFDDTRERALARKAAIEEREKAEQEQKAKNTPFVAAPMKEDRKKEKNHQNTEEKTQEPNDNQNNNQE